ncbi:hypothetical protein Q427_25725 [Halomonas sp. BC04]|nr:hypothetical protein Q427_25725 [Halomonas sp. BC04]
MGVSNTPSQIVLSDVAHHWIGGRVAPSTGERTQDVFNPATGEVSRKVALGSVQDVEAAVDSAKAALPGWAKLPPIRRSRILNNFLALLNEHRDQLAEILTHEHGKVFTDARVR